MIQYPLEFVARAETQQGIDTAWEAQSDTKVLTCAVPKEFEGSGDGLSPEDLFAQALTNCFLATFKVYAHHSKLSYKKVVAKSSLIVDVGSNSKPIMKQFILHAQIHGPSNRDKALLLAKKASDSGFVLNSVKTQCNFDFEIL